MVAQISMIMVEAMRIGQVCVLELERNLEVLWSHCPSSLRIPLALALWLILSPVFYFIC